MTYHANLQDLSVYESLVKLMDSYPMSIVAVVRSIDSSYLKQDLEKILQFHDVSYKVINGNLCLFKEDLRDAVSAGVFTGFDEVWLFYHAPPSKNLTSIPNATSDSKDFGGKVDREMLEAFHETKCVVILADGCGLNYLTSDFTIAEKLRTKTRDGSA